MSDTKENILLTSLALFARDGYKAVSVSMIAGELGITKGALYKHYKNKRDIFEHIIARMDQRDAEQASKFDLPEGTLADMEEKYRAASAEQIINFSKAQLDYWTQDGFACDFRRMLVLEQYRDKEMNLLYRQYLVTGPVGYVTDLLSSLGYDEPQSLALELYAPMFYLYSVFDVSKDINETEQLAKLHFDKIHKKLIES